MKRKVSIFLLISLSGAWLGFYISTQSQLVHAAKVLPTLADKKAVGHLEASADYNSLAKALAEINVNETDSISLFAESSKMTASDGSPDDTFGWSVDISGDTAIVGANNDDIGANQNQGSAYIFVRSGTGWTQQAKLVANDGEAADSFGNAVAIDGDTAVVGAISDDFGTNVLQGSAYVFTRIGSTWTQQQKLIAVDGNFGDFFGASVTIDGETIIVGVPGGNVGPASVGTAYVFVRSGTTWTQQQKLFATGNTGGNKSDSFGNSVAIDGNTAIIGSVFDNVAPNSTDQGAAYIFTRSGTTWTQQARLIASDGEAGDRFGEGVGISGETAVIGSVWDDTGTNLNQGSAYIFVRNGANWTQQQKLTISDGATEDLFGIFVAISGDTIIISSSTDDIATNQDQGSAYIFTRSGSAWTQQQELIASDGAAGDQFGSGVAISGNSIITGARADDIGTNSNQGSAYVFVNSARRAAFDFDGDGKADQSVFRSGVWYLLRSSSGLTAAQFGSSTDRIVPADFDGDGKADIAVFRDGIWYWLNSSNGSFNAVQFGQAGDVPVPADFTGDGRAELAVYRGGFWYTLNLANNQFQGVQFGISTDKPVPADFDGDSRTDFAVYRDGIWYMLRSTAGFTAVQFGIASDKLTVGDFDGDSKADQAVYRSGIWYILGTTNGFSAVQFGAASDIPVAADYDGDGKTDVAVFRDGVWYLLRSQQGFGAVQFGTTNDKPIPAAFVP